MVDDEIVEAEMDEYFHQQPDEDYIDPRDYSYVDPRTGLTPKQQAWLDYQQDLADYEANWIGTPYMDRTEDPPQWEDYWREPENFRRPNRQYQYHKQYNYTPKKESTKGEDLAIALSVIFGFIAVVTILVLILM